MTAIRTPSGRASPHTGETDSGEKSFSGGINEGISLTRTTKESREPTRKQKDVIIKQPEDTVAAHVVKHEDDASYALDHDKGVFETTGVRVAGAQHPQRRDHTNSFETLEKGIIYFFYRPRVDSPRACGLEDVARSFIVLRPTPRETPTSHLGGSIALGKTFRVLVVPKKVLPSSSRMKEMGFVEKAGIHLEELQETLITELHYDTKSHGARTVSEARMFAKGVYSITSTQHGSYLAYILTDPTKIGSVQEDFGLRERGKWLVQSKNPNVVSPPSVSLPDKPTYPKGFEEVFGDHRWVPLQPKLIDYPNAQLLLIGQPIQTDATVLPGLKHEDMDTPDKQFQELAGWLDETEKNCRGVDSIYGDLGLEVYHHPKISPIWDY